MQNRLCKSWIEHH